ncbi:hypothetical protein ABZX40_09540 [Streptomyces sp. NPDC004610]|uniref:hypothetical protein n=1 Tax=unclassified Streptomyces TaxID=2593676 RepID=UPI0033A3EB4F
MLRAVARWTAAVAVFAVLGAGTAYGITRMERTDVPGLGTASDGRWAYPEIVRPPLPEGSPAPFDKVNLTGTHHADLRKLVLPAPEGATADGKLRGADGWLRQDTFLAEFEAADREELAVALTDQGLRHIAATGWSMPDGTRTRIYLLRFDTATAAEDIYTGELTRFGSPGPAVRGAGTTGYDEDFPVKAHVEGMERSTYVESKPYGAEQVRQGWVSAGDVVAVILQSREGGAAAVPFQQTVILQSQLLG